MIALKVISSDTIQEPIYSPPVFLSVIDRDFMFCIVSE